jgi:hypothetical protein
LLRHDEPKKIARALFALHFLKLSQKHKATGMKSVHLDMELGINRYK